MYLSFFVIIFCMKEMVTSKDMKFITIDKQEDLPTDIEIKGRLSGAIEFEELVLPNGDIIVSNKYFQEDNTVPLNVEASLLYATLTGSKKTPIRGHCYLIKKNVKYWHTTNGRRAKGTPRGKYRKGDKAEVNKLVNTEAKNIIEKGDPLVHNDTTVRPEDERRLPLGIISWKLFLHRVFMYS